MTNLRNIDVLTAALEIVEQRLCEPMNAAALAKSCHMSYSGLQKLFGYALGCSVSEYITKRRLSRASRELLTDAKSITDIALDYQYGSPEAFSRAFKRFWGISPSEFRKTRRFADLHPKFRLENKTESRINNTGGIAMTTRKPLDVSELYDTLKKLGGKYVLAIDLIGFKQINDDYGYATGDAVLAEVFARVERTICDDMLLFRIGGDEFAVVTAYADVADAEALARKLTEPNGNAVKTAGAEIPLAMRVGISQIPAETLNYQDALEILAQSITQARKEGDHVAVV